MKINNLCQDIKENIIELILLIIILFLFILLFTNPEIGIKLVIMPLVVWIGGIIEGVIMGTLLEKRVQKRLREKKTRRGGIEFRPLEYIFFLSIFLATIMVTFAAKYWGFNTIDEFQSYIIYWGLTFFFYALAGRVGFSHYIKGIHGKIKN